MCVMEKLVLIMLVDMFEMWFGKIFNWEGLDVKMCLLLIIGVIIV